ncbi:MAG: MFS transporter [Anaerolineae bacterium]
MKNLRPFYLLVITQTLSLIGSRMTSIAVGIRVTLETGQAAPLLLVAFFNELPPMLLGSAAGVLIDRWPRKWVMVLADAGQAVGSLLLLASFLSGAFQLWHLYAVSLMQGVFAMFQAPAQDAVTTVLVNDAQRDRANALKQMSFPLAGVIAPAVTGLLYPLIQISGIIAIDMLTFVIAVGVVARMRIPQPPASTENQQAAGGFWRELRGGLAYLWERRALLWLVLYFTIINFLLNGPLGLNIPYLLRITGSETQTGLILTAESLGALAGGAAIVMRGGRRRMHIILPSFLLTGAMFILYGTSRTPLLLAVSLFLLLFTLPLTWGLYTSLLQVKTPADMQGRMFSLTGQLGFAASTTSFLLTGPLVDNVIEPATSAPGLGIGALLVGVGVVILILTAIMFTLKSVRDIEMTLPDYGE